MTTEGDENEPPRAKRRKLAVKSQKIEHEEPFYPFRLVPSPQEARTLETSNFPPESLLMDSGRLGDFFLGRRRCF